jgi:hypothetical protein
VIPQILMAAPRGGQLKMHKEEAMQTRTCGECVHWEDVFEGVQIGCLHLGKGARFSEDCPADAPACAHFEDPADPSTGTCKTCGRWVGATSFGPREDRQMRCNDLPSMRGKHSGAHCKRWKPNPAKEVRHA